MRRVAKTSLIAWAAAALLPAPAMAADASPGSIVTVVERICLPLIAKQPVETVASAAGLTRPDGDWTLKMQGEGSARILPPSPANPTVCMANLSYEQANGEAMRSALAAWAGAKKLAPVKAGVKSRTSDLQYRTSSWSGPLGGKATTVIFTEQTELDGRPTGGALYEAVLVVNKAS